MLSFGLFAFANIQFFLILAFENVNFVTEIAFLNVKSCGGCEGWRGFSYSPCPAGRNLGNLVDYFPSGIVRVRVL
jgi:hypothetical protein